MKLMEKILINNFDEFSCVITKTIARLKIKNIVESMVCVYPSSIHFMKDWLFRIVLLSPPTRQGTTREGSILKVQIVRCILPAFD